MNHSHDLKQAAVSLRRFTRSVNFYGIGFVT